MAEKKNIPQIRFKNFTAPWEQRKLGDVGSVAMNKRIFKEQTTVIGDIPFYKIGTFGGVPDAFISRDLFKEYRNKYPYPNIGDILISASGSIGRTVEYTGEDEYFQDSNIVWVQHDERLDNSFLKQFYSMVKWHGLEGSTIKRLYNKNILDTKINVPLPDEQRQIGTFFQQLDALITLHQRKHDKLTVLKKSMLEKMFPKDGAEVPEVRFSGFTNPWEQRKLGELAGETTGGGTPRTSNGEYWEGDLPWLQSSDLTEGKVFEARTTRRISQKGLAFSAAKFVPAGSIAIVIRVGVGKLAYLEFPYATSQDFLSLSKLIMEPWFSTYAIFRKLQGELHAVQGTSIKGITKEELLEKKIYFPCVSEQAKIGVMFRNLDTLITLHQRELDILKRIKTACLEKMFV